MVGQQFIALLANHPWFTVEWLGASQRSEGKAFRDAAAWRLASPLPDDVATRVMDAATPGRAPALVFSGLDSSVAGEIEGAFARAGHTIVSNSRNYRMEPDVPLLIPEVNGDHLALLDVQASGRGWKGRIVTNPNCSTVVLATALAPLRQFGLKTTMVTTLQAISGAGYPGVPSWDILGNVIPFIGGEEEKIETETRKILGCVRGQQVQFHPVRLQCDDDARAGCRTGTRSRSRLGFEQNPTPEAIIDAWMSFRGARRNWISRLRRSGRFVYLADANRPQPILDVDRERRHGGHGRPPASVSASSTTSSSRSVTTRSAAPRARPS